MAFSTLLKENGLKITPTRIAILEIFKSLKIPLDAQAIWSSLKKDRTLKKTNEATVYRTLTSFEKNGILKQVNVRKESVYFELDTKHHHHIVCTNCDTVEDFENKEIEKALERIVSKASKFKNIKEHSVELFGLCRACA